MSEYTYRERRLRKAERLREWADKREARSGAALDGAHGIMEGIPLGQPILRGHHSQRRHERDLDRIDRGVSQSVEHARKAEAFRSRAANIEAAADRAIYDDDPDAIDGLRSKLAALEAERDAIKRYNATCRRGQPDESLLTDELRADLATYKQTGFDDRGAFPRFKLSNLGGTLGRTRKRLARLERDA